METDHTALCWDAEARLAILSFKPDARATGEDAAALVEALAGWIGTDHQPFGFLGDGRRVLSVDAGFRAVWSTFFRQHRADSHAALFGMSPVIRITAEMFRLGTGAPLKAFADEAAARAWLRAAGVRA